MQAALVLAAFYASPALAERRARRLPRGRAGGLPLAAGLALVLLAAPRAGIALISMFVEEEAALAVIGLGGLLFVLGRRALGLVVALLAALWIAAMVFAVMPAFHDPRTLDGAGGNRTLGHFADLRADPGAALTRAVPGSGGGQRDVGGASYRRSWIACASDLIPALPSGAALLLQDRDDTFSRHWVLPLLVAIWFATVVGLSRVRPGLPRSAALALLVAATVFSYALLSPFRVAVGSTPEASSRTSAARFCAGRRAHPSLGRRGRQPERRCPSGESAGGLRFPDRQSLRRGAWLAQKRPEFYLLDLYDELTNRATVSERLNPLNANRPYHVWSAGPKVLVLSDRPASRATLLGRASATDSS